MASCASIDIEDATQHLRDILKLDRPAGGSNAESQRPSSAYNGDLNGLLVPDPLSSGDGNSTNKPGIRTMPPINLQEKQVICLSGDDSSTCIGILAKEVEIVASSDSSISSKARGSNKVKIQPVAKYDWEQKYYYGNLIAVSNSFLAYAIRAANNGSAMVRVISVSTSERTLLKGFTGSVADLAFAHLIEPDSMASAASALHLLSPRPRQGPELGSQLGLDGGPGDGDRHSTPSLLEAALTQEVATPDSQVWPTAPDITRETCSTLTESPRNGLQEKHKSLAFHRPPYHLLQQRDSQDTSAEQSDHDDEVASLASASGGFGSKIPTPRLPSKDWKTKGSPRTSPKLKRKSKKDDGDSAVGSRLTEHQVAEPPEDWPALIWQQQRELAELWHNQEELLQRLCAQLEGLQSTVTDHVERALETRHEQEQRRLERALAEGQQRGGQLQEQLTQQLSQALSSAVAGRLERSVRDEIKKTVPPCVSRSLEPVAGQLSNSVATKLTAVEGSMKENISKLLKSKNLTDAIARAAADTLQGPMQAAYREAFQSVVLPAFEKSCQAMFQQINDSFRLGTQEYLQQLESHMKSRKAREQEAREPVLAQLRGLVSTLQSATEQMAATVSSSVRAEVQHQLHVAVGSLQESILAQVQRIVKGEVSVALKEQQATVTSSIMQAMRSAAGTPVPSAHLDCQAQQAHILQLLQQGHLNQAFQQALTAADLNLVLYVCETVDPAQVFGQPPCPLSQPVLLSLIQQLASDLGTRSDLKLSYLEEAVMHLDHSDPITRDHMGSVMAQVRQKLFQFLQADPHNSLSKAARRLSLMLHGLVTPSLP